MNSVHSAFSGHLSSSRIMPSLSKLPFLPWPEEDTVGQKSQPQFIAEHIAA